MLLKEQFAKTLLNLGDAPTLIGQRIAGRYKVERWLGEGGMGTVYLVEHLGIHKHLALKLLRSDLAAIPGVLSRFESEAMTAANLDHPNIANASDYGCTDDGRFYLVLEYVNGQELRKVLDEASTPLPLARTLFIVRQIARALAHAHELGVVHRDLKPENIMLVRREGHDDFVKVLDFGMAQISKRLTDEKLELCPPPIRDRLTTIGDIFGTPAYMAPEQSLGESTDGRTDLYSLGIILYEMLAGKRPFAGRTALELMEQHISTPPPPIRHRAPALPVPKDVEDLLQRLLAKRPADRIQRAQDLIAQLDRLLVAHRLVWPTSIAAAELSMFSQEPAAGQRISAITKAWTPLRVLRTRNATLAKVEDTIVLWRRRLRGPMMSAPRWLAVCGVLSIVSLSIGLAWRSRSQVAPPLPRTPVTQGAVPSPTVAVDVASNSAFESAAAKGLGALETLASRYPADLRLKRALLRSYTNQQQHVAAMRLIAHLATRDPGTGSDSEVVKSITAALHGDAEAVQAVTTLLERDLGAAGVDLMYELTEKRTRGRPRNRLNQSLSKPEVLALASPATRLAVELRTAKRCEAKRALLPRVALEGDERALTQIKSWTATDGCGFMGLRDCWPCLRKNNVLRSTIAALESRMSASP